jgi:hypothetical protein
VLGTLAAFASIGYQPQFPVNSTIYADPDDLPTLNWVFEENDPEDIGHIMFLPDDPDGVPVKMIVEHPNEFEALLEDVRLDEIAPGIPVRVRWFAGIRRAGLEQICPQTFRDLAVLDLTWPERGFVELADDDVVDDAEESEVARVLRYWEPQDGLTFDAYAALVAAMNASGACYLLDGCWVVKRDDVRPHWDGCLTLTLDLESDRKTFAALASLGFSPEPPVTPEDLADPAQREHWTGEGLFPEGWPIRVLKFTSPVVPCSPIRVFSMEPSDFEKRRDAATVEELSPGMPVLTIGPTIDDIVERPEVRRCVQWLKEVRELEEYYKELKARRRGARSPAVRPATTETPQPPRGADDETEGG